MNGPFDGDHYVIRKKFINILGAQFYVLDPQGRQLGYCRQKAFRLKEDIRIYADEQQSHELLAIRARQMIDFGAAYDVVDPATGQKVGALRRKGFASLLRDSWEVLDANDQLLASVTEDSMAMALLRRFLSNLIPQSFHLDIGGETQVVYKQNFNPFILTLNVILRPGARTLIDPRLALAAGVLLAAIEGRNQ